jgi:hypothetical protein
MSILKYLKTTSSATSATCSSAASTSCTNSSDTELESEPEDVEDSGTVTSGSLADYSSESSISSSCSRNSSASGVETDPCDPSLPLPTGRIHARNMRIRFMITIHNGKGRSFCSKWYESYSWLEYSPKVYRMFCFTCRCFARKVVGNVGRIDAAFISLGTQARRWKRARSTLS